MTVIRIHKLGGTVTTSMEVLADSHRKVQSKKPLFTARAVDNRTEFATDFLPAAGEIKLR